MQIKRTRIYGSFREKQFWFFTFELPPGAYDKTDHETLLDNMAKVSFSTAMIKKMASLIKNITSK